MCSNLTFKKATVMKDKSKHIEHYPENPPWTMFFDGPLYQRYDEFMKNKDFSKILLTNKLQLANSTTSNGSDQEYGPRHNWWDDPTGPGTHFGKAMTPAVYSSVSDDFYRNYKREEKRRTRRTRAFIVLGLAIIAALALGTALVIHYFFIPQHDDPKSHVNISFTGNTSLYDSTTKETTKTTLNMFETNNETADETSLNVGEFSNETDGNDDVLNPGGKIFGDTTEDIHPVNKDITTAAGTDDTQ